MKFRRAAAFVQGWALALAGLSAVAGVNTWSSLGPEGGLVQSAFHHPRAPHNLFAIVGTELYRSTDAGLHWQSIRLGADPWPAVQVVADPSSADRLYAIGSLRLYASTDGGASFVLRAAAGALRQVVVGSDGVVYGVNDASVVFRSVDAGQTWQTRGSVNATPESIGTMAIDPADSNRLYVTTRESGLYASIDGGASWQRRGLASVQDMATAWKLVADSRVPGRLWVQHPSKLLRSADYGNTWSTVVDTGFTSTSVSAFALDLLAADTIYIARGDRNIQRSNNAGIDWTVVAGTARAPLTLAVNPTNPDQLLVGTDTGLELADVVQHGSTRINSGVFASYAAPLIASSGQDRTYFLSGNGLYWLNQNLQPVAANNAALSAGFGFSMWPQVMHVASGARDTLFVATGDVLSRSVDDGQSWSALASIPGQATWLTGPGGDDQVLYAGGLSSGVARSLNGGASWSVLGSGLPAGSSGAPSDVRTLGFGSTPSVLYAGGVWGVYRSANAGASWQAANTGIADRHVYALAVDPRNDNRIVAAALHQMARSLDGGASWTDVGPALPPQNSEYFLNLDFDGGNPDIIYGITSARLMRSVDRGASWEMVAIPAGKNWELMSVSPDPRRIATVHVGSHYGGVLQFTFGTDLGISMPAPGSLNPGVATTLTFTARNSGPYHATAARVTIQLPASTTAVSASAPTANCTVASAAINCTLDALHANTVVPITVMATPAQVGTFAVSATISAAIAETQAGDNAASTLLAVTDPAPAPAPAPPSNGSPGGGSSGGGGYPSLWMILGLALMRRARRLPD